MRTREEVIKVLKEAEFRNRCIKAKISPICGELLHLGMRYDYEKKEARDNAPLLLCPIHEARF